MRVTSFVITALILEDHDEMEFLKKKVSLLFTPENTFIKMNRLGTLSALVLLSVVALGAATSCGKRFKQQSLTGGIRQWIVGGVEAVKGAYPWQVK